MTDKIAESRAGVLGPPKTNRVRHRVDAERKAAKSTGHAYRPSAETCAHMREEKNRRP